MGTFGVFVEAGGNQVFFANGALAFLRQQNVHIDTLIGFSSSAPVVLAFLSDNSRSVAQLFADKLDANESNFYLFRKPHFPHDEMYRSAVSVVVDEFITRRKNGRYVLMGTQSDTMFAHTKALFATILLAIRQAVGFDLTPVFKKLCRVYDTSVCESDTLKPNELVDFIMGTSSIYPFVKPRTVRGKIILEGALSGQTATESLMQCDKKMVIHTKKGTSGVVDDVFHLFSSDPIPGNMLNYTNGAPVRALHAAGEEDMRQNLALLRSYLTQ